jgi:hypothetical protein
VLELDIVGFDDRVLASGRFMYGCRCDDCEDDSCMDQDPAFR